MRGQACRGNMGCQGGWRNRRKIRCRKMAIWDRYSAANGLDGLEIYDWRAEAVRFELTEGFPFAGFQDSALNRSATPPRLQYCSARANQRAYFQMTVK